MSTRLLRTFAAAAAAIVFVAATQDPQDPPPPVQVPPPPCQGCLADVDFQLPGVVYGMVFDGGEIDVVPISVTWTITRDIEFHGLCGDLEGSCLVVRQCTAIGAATATITHEGNTQTFQVSAGVNECGASDSQSVDLGDFESSYSGGQAEAEITATCPACQ